MKSTSLLFILLIGLYTITSAGCKKSDDDQPPPTSGGSSGPPANEVWMQNNAFNPATISVPVNTTVKWVNKDGAAHTVTSNTGAFSSGTINTNGTFSFKFTAAGTYQYHCELHNGMNGTVVVQ